MAFPSSVRIFMTPPTGTPYQPEGHRTAPGDTGILNSPQIFSLTHLCVVDTGMDVKVASRRKKAAPKSAESIAIMYRLIFESQKPHAQQSGLSNLMIWNRDEHAQSSSRTE